VATSFLCKPRLNPVACSLPQKINNRSTYVSDHHEGGQSPLVQGPPLVLKSRKHPACEIFSSKSDLSYPEIRLQSPLFGIYKSRTHWMGICNPNPSHVSAFLPLALVCCLALCKAGLCLCNSASL